MTAFARSAIAGSAAFLLAATFATATRAAAPPAPSRLTRGEIEGIQSSVEAAVSRVSRPAGLLFGRGSRAYHLKGYGAVVVLAPRPLPRVRRFVTGGGPGALAFDDVLRDIERSVAEVRDPAERRRLQEAIAALKSAPPHGAPLPPPAPRPRVAMPPRDIEALQEQAEAFRREAERAMEKAERDVLVRLRFHDDLPPVPPLPPVAEEPPVPAMPTGRRVPAVPPAAFTGWPFPGGMGMRAGGEDVLPEKVVADVRRAIVSGLGAYRGDLSALAADEFVVVAVDFVSGVGDRAPAQTVVARARKKDLAEHRAGRLPAEAFRARVEFDDY